MAYIPNPADPTQPVGTVFAQSAAAEFRSLKSYLGQLLTVTQSWSTSNKHASLVLSNDNLTVTKDVSDGFITNVYGILARNTGKWYWEVNVDAVSGSPGFIGIAAANSPLTGQPGVDFTSGYSYGGPLGRTTGAPIGGIPFNFVPGDIIGVALDLDSRKVSFRKNNVLSPLGTSTATGIATTAYYPVVSLVTSGDKFTGVFDKQSMTYDPPAGFEPIFDSAGGQYINTPVRQSVQCGPVSGNNTGIPAYLTINGTNLDLVASTDKPVVFSAANGFGYFGARDVVVTLSENKPTWIANSLASSKIYLKVQMALNTAVPSAVAACPYYCAFFPRQGQALLHFDTPALSATFLDDFGNSWAGQGTARIAPNPKFGSGALGGSGAGNALNGTTDFIRSNDFSFIPSDNGWHIRAWVAPASNPGAGSFKTAVCFAGPGGNFGIKLGIFNNAGTVRWAFCLSSNNGSNDITSNAQGITAPTLSAYSMIDLVFDQQNGFYRLFVNGAQEQAVASNARVHNAISQAAIGASPNGAGSEFMDGYIDEVEFIPYSIGVSGAMPVPGTPTDISTPAYAADWFDTVNMQMKVITGPSPSAGIDPIFATTPVLYLGEANTGPGNIINSVNFIPYQSRLQQAVINALPFPAPGTRQIINHNLGQQRVDAVLYAVCKLPDSNFEVGNMVRVALSGATTAGQFLVYENKNQISFDFATAITALNKTTGAVVALTLANWGFALDVTRPW